MAEHERKPMPQHMFFPSSGLRNPLPFLETSEPEPWEKIIPRMSDDRWDIKEDGYLGFEKNVDVVELLKGPNRDFLIKKKDRTRTVQVPIEQELKGCYVIVACFLAPVLSASSDADPCHALIRLFEEVSSRRLNPECKIVIVTKVIQCAREIWTGRRVVRVAFNHFFSGFPEGFLTIPFSDEKSRDCELSRGDEFLKKRLNPFLYQDSPSPSPNYEYPLLSLAELFNHSPEDVLLAEIRGRRMVNPSPLSTLMKGQLVALYLCADGCFMDILVKLYLQCRERVPKLEVVVVPLAFSDYPNSYYNQIMLALAKRNISSWWALHLYNDKIMRTLFRLCGGMNAADRLILLPVVGENYSYCGDLDAHAVVSLLKVYPLAKRALPSSMYPFTTEKLYLERLSSLHKVTLTSLLCRFKPDRSSEDFLKQVQGKNVLLCLALFSEVTPFFVKLRHKYPEILEKYGDCKLIGVAESENPPDDVVSMIPWMFLLPDALDSMSRALYFEDLGEDRKDEIIVAFGGDGCILSRRAHNSLDNTDNLFDDVLRDEVYEEVTDDVETEADCMP